MEEAMVGAVVGATIQVVLQNLLSFPTEEIGLFWNFNKDLQKLKESVLTIRDFMEDAEMKQVTDKPVKRWLMKLETVAFDADYVFDQLNYQVLRKRVETDNKMKKRVSFFFSTSNPIAFRHKMARKIKDINKELKSINQEARELGLQMRFAVAHARGAGIKVPAYLETDSFSMDPVFIGREDEVTKIVEMVSSRPTEQVISVLPIVGMGGSGKTTLARKVYNDAKIISHFGERERIWVHLPLNFDPVIVLKKTLESLTEKNVDGSREVIMRKLGKRLADKRYLLVLDNFWDEDTDKWENFITSLKGISPVKGNVIMVTTRKSNVASIVKTLDSHELKHLSKEDCWFIIKAKAFGVVKTLPSEFETIGENIAERCGGLPLAAQVLGSLLRGKSEDEWVSIEKNWLSNFGGDDNTISKILKLSFDNLSSPSLKKCFALCSIIPKDWWMEKDELIDLWMAEGLLQTDQEKNMEIFGNRVLNILVHSSLLQVHERDCYGNVTSCYMHDLVHDLASSILNPKFLDSAYQVRYVSRPSIDESSPITKEHAKCLRALFFSGNISHIMFSNLKCLHVLIMNDEGIKELPIEIGKLISMRFLDISHTRIECLPDSIGDLYHLQTLRATEEYGGESYLRKLPDSLKYLISLRRLYIPNIKLPPEIGKLVSLQTLPYFQVGDEEGSRIMELASLTDLGGAIEIHNLEKVRDKEEAKSADLFHKPNIFKLKLVWNNVSAEGERRTNDDENVLEGLQPHPNLKSLEINGFKGRSFPPWMAVREDLEDRWVRLDKLLEIKLSGCKECQEIPMLGHLPRLKSLCLHHLPNVKSIGSSFYGITENEVYKKTIVVFPALEKLELIEMTNLTSWTEVELASSSESTQPRQVSVFGRLESLKINNCRRLKSAPSDFPCLKELEIDNMESELPLASICGSKLTSLTKLNIAKVDGLEYLPDGLFYKNRDLLELDIRDCDNLTHLIPRLGGVGAPLRKLTRDLVRRLRGGGASLRRKLTHQVPWLGGVGARLRRKLTHRVPWLGASLRKLTRLGGGGVFGGGGASLRKLMLQNCWNLEELPKDLHSLNALEELRIRDCPDLLSIPYTSQGFTSLRHLEFSFCSGLTNFPCGMLDSCATSLEELLLLEIESLTNLPQVVSYLHNMPRLTTLEIEGVPKFTHHVAEEIASLRNLQWLGIGGSSDCRDYVSFKANLDRIFPALQSLPELRLYGMEHWDALPDQLHRLTALHQLSLCNFGIEELPEWLGNLSSLQTLELYNCERLRSLPSKKAMQGLTKLTHLCITDCPVLKHNMEQEATHDSECSKISHIPNIDLDGRPFSAHAQ